MGVMGIDICEYEQRLPLCHQKLSVGVSMAAISTESL